MKVDGSLKSLLQGVSQQPMRDRLPGQCTEQLNMSADPVTGLARRPPTDLVADLMTTSQIRAFHEFEVQNGNRYLAAFSQDRVLDIFDMNGVRIDLARTGNVDNYIRSDSGKLTFATVDNSLIIVNTSVIPRMRPETKGFCNQGPGSRPMALVQVLGGAYGRDYKLMFNNEIVALYRPPNGSDAAHTNFVRTSHIASRLFESMTTSGPDQVNLDGAGSFLKKTGFFVGPWTVARAEDVIFIDNTFNGATFTMTCTDDAGNVNLKVMTNTVRLSSDLPRYAPNRYVARVAKETDPEEDLWFEFRTENGDTGIGSSFGQSGYWQETVSPWVAYKIDPAFMPMVLDLRADGGFLLREGNWRDRKVGTDVNNPLPSFIGQAIQDVTTFQSRLVILAGSYVCMSRTNRPEDFWLSTASAVVDADPIDISSTAAQATTLYSAVPHNRDLVLFSTKGQFVIFGKTALTPQNASIALTTSFEAELNAKPVAAGRNVFFATNYGRFTGIREFFTEGGTDINDTRPVTQHVKEYLVGKVVHMAATSNYDMLAVKTGLFNERIYIYQYIWADTDKIQSAWSTWEFRDEVHHFWFEEELMYIVFKSRTSDQFYLERMSLDVLDNDGVGYPVMLDSRFDVNGARFSIQYPFARMQYQPIEFVQGAGCPNPGLRADVMATNGTTVVFKQDMLGGHLVGGVPYTSRYRPTMPRIKDQAGVVQSTAKLRVKHFLIALARTGDINGVMHSEYGDGPPVKHQARLVSAPNNQVGVQPLSDDTFVMPFRDQTDRADFTVFTSSHLPMTLLDVEWTGQYTKSGRRIAEGGN